MRKSIIFMSVILCFSFVNCKGQNRENVKTNSMKQIILEKPSAKLDVDVMTALQKRKSEREFTDKEISLQQLSDLLWAAKGINRPKEGKMTSPTAMNSQEVDVYVCMKDGTYIYNNKDHTLLLVSTEDVRKYTEQRTPNPPVVLLITADVSRYRNYDEKNPEKNDHIINMSIMDCGIVSQNISLYCAAAGLSTVPRAGMRAEEIAKALKFNDTRTVWINHPIGFAK